MVVATTDPVIAAEVEHQSGWKRHPFATIRLETTQTAGTQLLSVAGPWAVMPAASAAENAPGRRESQAERGRQPVKTEEAMPDTSPVQQSVDDPVRPGPLGPRRGPGPPPYSPRVVRLRRVPGVPTSPLPLRNHHPSRWIPWIIVGAAILAGVAGSIGYAYLTASRRHKA